MNLRAWLPSTQQMSDAAQLRALGFADTTMRQALGMIVWLGLLAGALPFLVNWGQAASAGTALPLARLGQAGAEIAQAPLGFVPGLLSPVQVAELLQTLAGLDQPFPGWLAAFVSALGEWINWPLRWLSLWILYGALVMSINKGLGAGNRLQPFFAATGFAAVPLLLTGLAPIPCLGGLASVAGVVWALVVYARANEVVTGMPRLRAFAAVLAPLVLLFFSGLLLTFLSGLVGFLLVGSFVFN